MDQWVCALHASNVIVIELECDNSIKIDFFTLAGRERIVTSEETENLLLLLLQGQLRNVQIFNE